MATQVVIESFGIEKNPQIKIFLFKGQIDSSNLPNVGIKLNMVVNDMETIYILLNFKALDYINSNVIEYLASLYSQAVGKNKKLILVEANENMMDIMSLMGLTTIIDHYATLEEALGVISSLGEIGKQ